MKSRGLDAQTSYLCLKNKKLVGPDSREQWGKGHKKRSEISVKAFQFHSECIGRGEL